ncbi:MAG: DUF3524 domain-containing protein [Kouleothrix sp.]|jgi:glycosyltransferase involved in cell wall biosynthesis|nr:DUF3524 domain-containing protein [Kouleothrix sp.]
MSAILLLNPFHAGSHAAVAEGYAARSRHTVTVLPLSQAGGWRWRMRGAAVTLARRLREQMREDRSATRPGLVVATDMLDLATFLGLTRDLIGGVPAALYMHENQLTYPLPAGRARDLAFPWINYTSALAADALFFNSAFHRAAFLAALPGLPGRYHDHHELDLIDAIGAKSQLLPPGIDLARLDQPEPPEPGTRQHPDHPDSPPGAPIILWNSRWEYDKGPAAFFAALRALAARGVDFRVVVVGEQIDPNEPNFQAARAWLGERVLAWGYLPDLQSYRAWLWRADIVVSCAVQEFFGISVIEAMYCGCVPILPRRLSYPELLPPALHAGCLYDDQDDLVEKLHHAIRNLPALRACDFRSVAARYDWRELAPEYDARFEALQR